PACSYQPEEEPNPRADARVLGHLLHVLDDLLLVPLLDLDGLELSLERLHALDEGGLSETLPLPLELGHLSLEMIYPAERLELSLVRHGMPGKRHMLCEVIGGRVLPSREARHPRIEPLALERH